MGSEVTSDTRLVSLRAHEFNSISSLVRDRFGISLGPGKEKLVAARLSRKVRELRLSSFRQYLNYVVQDATGAALEDLVDTLTTNYTAFFREPEHYRLLRQIAASRAKSIEPLRIWSAACSTGEEAYSIVFTLSQEPGVSCPQRFHVVASDLSRTALATAQRAIYKEEAVAGISKETLRAFFERGEGPSRGLYRVKRQFVSAVGFARLNLIEGQYPPGSFDVIFCRNVMIYFDRPKQAAVVRGLTRSLSQGGYLFTGHSESLTGISDGLEYVQPAVYRKSSGAART